MVSIEATPAPLGYRRSLEQGAPSLELSRVDEEVEATLCDVEADQVTILNQCQRASAR